jgi:hypothetical protein
MKALPLLQSLSPLSQKPPRLLKKSLSDQLVSQNRTSPHADKTRFSVPEIGVRKRY